MSRPEVRVVVLFEDDQHQKFVRRLADKLGLKPARLERCGGCVNVMDRFETELKAMRSRMKYQKNLGLMVVIDADDKDHRVRIRELERRLLRTETGGPRLAAERIAFVVPALEIENWYVHLCLAEARPVDDARDYKSSPEWKSLEGDLASAARRAIAAWDVEIGREDPSSLTDARAELARL